MEIFNINEKGIHKIFFWSLILKGFNAVLEIAGGILFLFPGFLTQILNTLIEGELIEDPHDFLAIHIQSFLPYLSGHTYLFSAFYLLSHGVIKILLVGNLLRNKLWAYPATISVLIIFILYQLYRISVLASPFLIFLTLFDMLLVWLTWHEYMLVKKHI